MAQILNPDAIIDARGMPLKLRNALQRISTDYQHVFRELEELRSERQRLELNNVRLRDRVELLEEELTNLKTLENAMGTFFLEVSDAHRKVMAIGMAQLTVEQKEAVVSRTVNETSSETA